MHPTEDGRILVGGWAWSFGQGLGDVYLLKIMDGAATAVTLDPGFDHESLLDLKTWPNPSRGSTSIGLELGKSGWAHIAIVDAAGRLIRVISDGPLSEGRHTINWNGCDERGRRIASGVYFVRFRNEEREKSHRLTVLR